jgi:translocation and assembly module TamB
LTARTPSPRSRFRAVARTSLAVIGTVLVFVVATVAGIALHLDHPAGRRLVGSTVNSVLAPVLNGSITLDKVDRIALVSGRVAGMDVTIRDAEGRTVIVARWVSAQIALVPLVRSLIDDGPLLVRLEHVRIDGVDLTLRDDASGVSSLANTFLPRESPQPEESDEQGTPGAGFVVTLDEVSIGHVWAHGSLGGQPMDIELDGLSGHLRVDPDALAGTLRPVVFRVRALPIAAGAAEGSVEGVITFPFAEDQRTAARVSARARAGDLSATARATLHGEAMVARIEVPTSPASALSAVVEGLPLIAPVRANLEVSGTLTAVAVKGRVDVGEGHVELAASAKQDGDFESWLTARVVRLSLSQSFVGMPPGIIDAEVEATASVAQGALRLDYHVLTSATTMGGQQVPSVATHGSFDGERLTGKATIYEPGALTTASYVLAPEQEDPPTLGLDVDVRTEIPNLALAPRLGTSVGGAASTRVQGHITLDEKLAFRAVATGRAAGLATGSIGVERVLVNVRARGTVRSPLVHATAFATRLRGGSIEVASATVHVDGEVLAPRVRVAAHTDDGDSLVASARVVLGRSTTVRDVDARLVRKGEEVRARVSSVRVSETGTALQGVSVQGAGGSLLGSLSDERGALRVSVTSTALDLGRIRVLVGPSMPALTGMATVEIDLVAAPDSAKGFARVSARDVGVGADVRGARVDGEVVLDGRSVTIRAAGSVPDVGTVLITSDGARLGEGPLGISSYRTATGALNAMVVADLARVAALLPKRRLPVDHIAGKALITLHARRLGESEPEVSMGITTAGLEVAAKTVDGVGGRSLRGVDVALTGNHDPHTGWVTLDAFARDAHGLLAEVHVGARPSRGVLLVAPERLREEVFRTPFELEASVPRRSLQDLPDAVRVARLQGVAALEVSASGTALDPKATVSLRASDVTVDDEGPRNKAVDLRLDAAFEDGRGSSTAELSSEGRTFLVARGEGTLQVADLFDGRGEGPRWSAGGDLAFSGLPLRALHLLAGQPINGCVSGTVSLRGLHEDAMVDADMHFDDLRVGRAVIRSAKVRAHAGKGSATVDARVEQEDGLLTAKGSVGIVWGAALIPSVDRAREATGRVRAEEFRLAPLRPFLRRALGRIDGTLDADLRYRGTPSDPARASFEGEASVRDGVVDVALIGQELREIQGKLTISRNGELRLRDASAEGIAGRVVIDATAHLDWLALRDAKATVRIARGEAMSITYEGAEFGNAWGDVDITVANEANGVTAVDIALPRFHLELPNETARSSQKLDDEPTVRMGTHTEEGFVTLLREPPKPAAKPTAKPAANPTTEEAGKPSAPEGGVLVRIALGREVRVYRTNAIDAWLSGKVHALLRGSRLEVSGAVQVDRGFVEIQGRRFGIEHAMASFDPTRPPEDPTVTATAVYDAPDATRIFADYTGTAETGKLRLYSDPALEQTEILSLIAFGTREGGESSRGSSSAGAVGTAASAGGGIAAQGLNKVLSDITPVDITTRVDTSDAQDPRPEVAVAITDKVSASVGYRVSLPMPGQNPDRSMLRVEYRFRPRWLLETTVGDKGTSIVDLVWKLRY